MSRHTFVALAACCALAATAHAQSHPGLRRATPSSITELRQWDQRVDAMQRGGELRVERITEDADVAGRTHERALQYYKGVRDHVVYVHIKDGLRKDGKASYTYPGEGEGRLADVLRDLLKRGYKGGLSIEPHLAAIVHEGKAASQATSAYEKYLEYGRRLMKLAESVE